MTNARHDELLDNAAYRAMVDRIAAQTRAGIDGLLEVDAAITDPALLRLTAAIREALSAARAPSGEDEARSLVLARENEEMRRELAASKRSEQEARSARSVLEYVINNVPHMIFWKDLECRLLGANGNFCKYLGYPIEDLRGKGNYDLGLPLDQADFFTKCDKEVMANGVPLLDIEEELALPDGGMANVLTSKVPLRNEQGEVIGMLGIFADVTRMKRLEGDLVAAKEAAEGANRAKGDFLATMSHELRTPLTLILSPLDSVLAGEAGPLGEAVSRDLARVRRSALRLKILVDDILDYSKADAGKMQVRWEPVDAVELVSLAVADAQPAAAAQGIALSFEGPGESLDTIPLDPGMLEKIVLNLLGNALKFTPKGGEVVVSLKTAGPEIELSVRDTGIGISEDQLPLLFERFRQVDASSTRKYGGTGLGLSLIKQLTHLMGGTVRAESQIDRGSRFTVSIPRSVDRLALLERADAASAKATRRSSETAARLGLDVADQDRPSEHHEASTAVGEQSAGSLEKPRIVFAEDNPDLSAYVVDLLSDDYEIIVTVNGSEALDAVRACAPDIIISDVMMPVMDGFELLAQLKADADLRHIPVLLLTARAGREATASGLDRGADDYLAKPFSARELRARVRASLRLHRMYQEVEESKEELESSLVLMRKTLEQLVEAERMALSGQFATETAPEVATRLSFVQTQLESLRDVIGAASGSSGGAGPPLGAGAGAPLGAGAGSASLEAQRILETLNESAQSIASIAGLLADLGNGDKLFGFPSGPRIDVGNVVAQAAPSRVLVAGERSREVAQDMSPGVSACVDPEDLKTALHHVLAFLRDWPHAAAPDPRRPISMRAEARDGRPCLTIADPLLDLSSEERSALFHPEQRADGWRGSRVRRIGLAIAERVLNRNGGDFAVEQQPTGGTTFCMRLSPARD